MAYFLLHRCIIPETSHHNRVVIALWNWVGQVIGGPNSKYHMEGEIYICEFWENNSMEFYNDSQGKVMSWSLTKYILSPKFLSHSMYQLRSPAFHVKNKSQEHFKYKSQDSIQFNLIQFSSIQLPFGKSLSSCEPNTLYTSEINRNRYSHISNKRRKYLYRIGFKIYKKRHQNTLKELKRKTDLIQICTYC